MVERCEGVGGEGMNPDPLVCTCTPTMRAEQRRCEGCIADDREFAVIDAADLPTEITTIEGAHVFPAADAIGHETINCACGPTEFGLVTLHHRLDTQEET